MPHSYSFIELTDGHMVVSVQLGLSIVVYSHNHGVDDYSRICSLCQFISPTWTSTSVEVGVTGILLALCDSQRFKIQAFIPLMEKRWQW